MADAVLDLRVPADWSAATRRRFLALGKDLLDNGSTAKAHRKIPEDPSSAAATLVLLDLVEQGWRVRTASRDVVTVEPPLAIADPATEKERVRRQELIKRDEQLNTPSVRRFVAEMERPREFHGKFVSIFSVMRDGLELADGLRGCSSPSDIIDPYVQVIHNSRERCPHTGLRLVDIWRYFRHTWSNQYTSTPGRTMALLVRDRAANAHPIIGIAALGSPIVQIRERDEWIGWLPAPFLEELRRAPSLRVARWLCERLDQALSEIYVDDLLEDGLYWPSLWEDPSVEAIARLLKESDVRRRDHHRFVRRSEFKSAVDPSDVAAWQRRAESNLFRSKRCLALAEVLRTKAALSPFLLPKPSRAGLAAAVADADGRRAIAQVLRRAKAEAVGTEMADLTVCGAVAPYNAILGGKLVAMLCVSPSVVSEYHRRYVTAASEIASAVAGRPIRRRANLAFIGTTSLYGSGSSQYNRVKIPAEVLGGDTALEFRELGRSRSFGTSHLSSAAVSALVRLSEQSRSGVRVNSIFGEGVNPKLRKVRDGLEILAWPSDELLQHRRQRIVYGVSLVTNLLPYLLGIDATPQYRFGRELREDQNRIAAWWMERWLAPRARSEEVLGAVAKHTQDRPVIHGARVVLPQDDVDSA